MNKYLDKWRYQLDARYHDKYAHWTRVIIISNTNPWDWWPLAPVPLREAIFRRFQNVIEVLNREQIINFE